MTLKKYVATQSGFILGTFYKKGASVPLTPVQAKYLAAPYGNDVVEDKSEPKTKAK